MAALPGSPQIQNLIPIKYFQTTAMAAPITGVAVSLIMLIAGYLYLKYRGNTLRNNGENYDEPAEKKSGFTNEKIPNFLLSLAPLCCVVVLLNVLNFNIINALLCGIILILVLNITHFKNFISAINDGASGSVIAIINTRAAVGFGSVVKSVPGFQNLIDLLLSIISVSSKPWIF